MGLLIEYFSATSDAAAGATVDEVGGPGGAAGTPVAGVSRVVDGSGIEPVVSLGKLEHLLTGKSFEDQLEDPSSRALIELRDGGERLVLRLGDDFIASLAAASEADLLALVDPWTQIEEFGGSMPADHLAQFLPSLSRLAKAARDHGQGLYCWICV